MSPGESGRDRWLVFVGDNRNNLRSDHAVNLERSDVGDWGKCSMRYRGKLEAAPAYVVVEAGSEAEAIDLAEKLYYLNADGQLRQVGA